jgi:hypothetical protein
MGLASASSLFALTHPPSFIWALTKRSGEGGRKATASSSAGSSVARMLDRPLQLPAEAMDRLDFTVVEEEEFDHGVFSRP